jgi:hypothetical protein
MVLGNSKLKGGSTSGNRPNDWGLDQKSKILKTFEYRMPFNRNSYL